MELQDNLASLFTERKYQELLALVTKNDITPQSNPTQANIAAAALFQLGNYQDCLLWCEGLFPSLGTEPSFSSMYGAVLRRLGRLNEAESVFRSALADNPENLYLRNNFANLLIDLSNYDEAEKILDSVLLQNPDYHDAQVNLNRLRYQRSAPIQDAPVPQQQSQSPSNDNSPFDDPIHAAFSDEEVSLAGGVSSALKRSDQKSLTKSLDPGDLVSRSISTELQESLKLARLTLDTDPESVLNDCSVLHQRLGIQPAIYNLAADAYIRLKLFADAETCLLTALSIGSKDASVLLNLANVCAMRGDELLSTYWLQRLAESQPDHPQLESVRRHLFPNVTPSKSSTPFQINLEQTSKGSFKKPV